MCKRRSQEHTENKYGTGAMWYLPKGTNENFMLEYIKLWIQKANFGENFLLFTLHGFYTDSD